MKSFNVFSLRNNMISLVLTGLTILGLSACQSPQGNSGNKKEAMTSTKDTSQIKEAPIESLKDVVGKMKQLSPARGYLAAHKSVDKPFGLLGGPITATVKQTTGGVFVALPAYRKLDPVVFGTPEYPRAFGGTPGITGLPIPLRKVENGQFTEMKVKSPFGDKYKVLPDGRLDLTAVDATATDAAKSNDKVNMDASWKDGKGNTYSVKCCQNLATYGMEYPTFGGVVTNVILHGFTNIGTPLMPSEYTYLAFWGFGSVSKNGKVIDKDRLIHGMLTEYVRKEDYKLGFDKDVTPTRRQFHLIVPPFMPDPAHMTFKDAPLKTGYIMESGSELPFWHVMFENLNINASRK